MGGAREPHIDGIFKTNDGSYDVCLLLSRGQVQRLTTIVASTVSVLLLICRGLRAERVPCIRIIRRCDQSVLQAGRLASACYPLVCNKPCCVMKEDFETFEGLGGGLRVF